MCDIARRVFVPDNSHGRLLSHELPLLSTTAVAQPPRANPVPAQLSFEGTGVDPAVFRLFQPPNWRIERILGVVPVRYDFTTRPDVRALLVWDEALRTELQREDMQVQVRLFSVEGKEVRFKPECNLMLNNEMVTIPACPLPRKNIAEPHWTPAAPSLERLLLASAKASAVLQFSNAIQLSGVAVVQLVCRVTEQDLVRAVPLGPVEEARAREGMGADDGGDLEEMSFTACLDDPLIMSRIATPVKGLHCAHFQCFDCAVYVQHCVARHCWNCPVCHRPAPYQTLSINRRFRDLLLKFPDARAVQVLPDGSYLPHDGDSQQKYERKLVAKRKIAHSASATPVIDLGVRQGLLVSAVRIFWGFSIQISRRVGAARCFRCLLSLLLRRRHCNPWSSSRSSLKQSQWPLQRESCRLRTPRRRCGLRAASQRSTPRLCPRWERRLSPRGPRYTAAQMTPSYCEAREGYPSFGVCDVKQTRSAGR